MRPLNEYPKEELEVLLEAVKEMKGVINPRWHEHTVLLEWSVRIREAISDQEFKEKELPFPDKKP